MNFAEKIEQLGFVLPPAPKPVGSYVPFKIVANTLFLSGQISKTAKGELITGKAGRDINLEEARNAAVVAALNAIAVIDSAVGLDRVSGINRVVGYVQTADDFYDISKVIDAASDFFYDVLGESGRHVRTAVGMASLPLNSAVELELTINLKESV